jgi:hypothetical protein
MVEIDCRVGVAARHTMAKLTGTLHGDAANALMAFYQEQVKTLEGSGHYFMAAVALGLALETAVLTYLLVEFGEENGGELQIPASVNMAELLAVANEIGLATCLGDFSLSSSGATWDGTLMGARPRAVCSPVGLLP